MMHPFEEYIEALKAKLAGKNQEAAQLLANSLGAPKPTAAIENNLDRFFEKGTTRIMAYRILEAEVRKRNALP